MYFVGSQVVHHSDARVTIWGSQVVHYGDAQVYIFGAPRLYKWVSCVVKCYRLARLDKGTSQMDARVPESGVLNISFKACLTA